METVLKLFHHACYFGQDNLLVALSLSCDGQTDFFSIFVCSFETKSIETTNILVQLT